MRARCTGSLVSSASRNTDTPSSCRRAHGTCLFGPRVRFSDDLFDDTTERSYTYAVTAMMTNSRMLVLAAITRGRLAVVIHRLPCEPRRGRPWSCSLAQRILITCAALRTNLTVRELAASFAISKSAAHRIVSTTTSRLAALSTQNAPSDRRESWVVDGTLIPTRDHRRATRSKNYRYSCNAQVLIRRRDLRVVATTAGGPGNRNDPVHYRGSTIETRCKQHGRVLADGAYRAIPELITPVFAETRSCATAGGADIVDAEPGSSTQLLVSRTGVSCETIAVAAVTSLIRSRPSPSFTIFTWMNYGTASS